MRRAPLDPADVAAWVGTHPAWSLEARHLVRSLATLDYPGAARLVAAQVDLAEELDHHPEITLGYRSVRVELWTHDVGGVTSLDLEYARAFDDLVAGEYATLLAPGST